jgi:hypothetical protein
MTFNYQELEEKLTEACDAVHKDFRGRFNNEVYISAGGSKLETFISDLQNEFEATTAAFIKKYNLEKDTEAKKRAFAITKLYAKKCIEDFSKV